MSKLASICDHTFFANGLNAESIVIDAGANHGNFSRGCMELFGCVPYALEANPETAARIVGPRVFPCALSAKSTELEFFIGPNSEACSIFQIPEHTNSIKVKAISLKDFLSEHQLTRIDLLKLDIEGAELELLSSLTSMGQIVQMSVEFHDFMFPDQAERVDSEIAHMKGLGFDYYNFSSPRRGDVLFVNPALLPLPSRFILRARARIVARHLRRKLNASMPRLATDHPAA